MAMGLCLCDFIYNKYFASSQKYEINPRRVG